MSNALGSPRRGDYLSKLIYFSRHTAHVGQRELSYFG
jgi:hypothetical protein